jgi:hypothetical protein
MFIVGSRAVVLSLSLITKATVTVHRKRSNRSGTAMAACSAAAYLDPGLRSASLAGAGGCCGADSDASSSTQGDVLNLFAAGLERLPHVKDAAGEITTTGFLSVCELTLPLIGRRHTREARGSLLRPPPPPPRGSLLHAARAPARLAPKRRPAGGCARLVNLTAQPPQPLR